MVSGFTRLHEQNNWGTPRKPHVPLIWEHFMSQPENDKDISLLWFYSRGVKLDISAK